MSFWAPYDEAPAAYDELFQELGETMMEWSRVEASLMELFQRLTGMEHKMARRIFFSARSFNGRADLLRAAIATTEVDAEFVKLGQAAVARSLQYSAFRNALAHGAPLVVPELGSPLDLEPVIVEERELFNPFKDQPTTMPALRFAKGNFELLGSFIYSGARWDGEDDELAPSKFAELIRQLPNPPQSKEADPRIAEERSRLLLRWAERYMQIIREADLGRE